MIPLLLITVTGRGIVLTLVWTLLALVGIAGVWWLFGPGPATLVALGVIGLIRGVFHLFTPPK